MASEDISEGFSRRQRMHPALLLCVSVQAEEAAGYVRSPMSGGKPVLQHMKAAFSDISAIQSECGEARSDPNDIFCFA